MNEELPQFSGHTVIDRHGTQIGTITDVVYDEMTEEPTWGVVSPGVLHSRHYVPLMPPVYVSQGGDVVVPAPTSYTRRASTAGTCSLPTCVANWSITTRLRSDAAGGSPASQP
jgi:hypothetical protein